jgi:hypothetical protein
MPPWPPGEMRKVPPKRDPGGSASSPINAQLPGWGMRSGFGSRPTPPPLAPYGSPAPGTVVGACPVVARELGTFDCGDPVAPDDGLSIPGRGTRGSWANTTVLTATIPIVAATNVFIDKRSRERPAETRPSALFNGTGFLRRPRPSHTAAD